MITMQNNYKILSTFARHKKQLLVATLFITTIIILKYFHITDYFTLTYLQDNIAMLHQKIEQHYTTACILYMLSYMGASALSLPGFTFFLTASGFLFGVFPGCVLAIFAACLGGFSLFLTSRYVIGSWLQCHYADSLKRFNTELTLHGFYYLLMVRLIGILPFFVVNLLSGITKIPSTTFLWTTCVGMIPFALVYSFIGSQLAYLGSQNYFMYPPIFFALLLFLVFKVVLVPVFYKTIKKRREKKKRNFTN